jgi:hypothetical protein
MTPSSHLTPAQQRALTLLSAGSTKAAAAQFVGVHRNTVGNWLRSAGFRQALTAIRRDQDLAWREQSRSLADQAIGAIRTVLADPKTPPAVRLEAALSIHSRLTSSQPPAPGRNQPCPCGSGRKFKRCCINSLIPKGG